MTLIYETPIPGPATHALVIGVGYYHHLPGGNGTQYPQPENLSQLTSPPHSARAFTEWLLTTYHNPERPLASLDLLISEPGASSFTLPGGEVKQVERAQFEVVRQALKAWRLRGNTSPDHLMILFFCGHGVSKGVYLSFLMEDFGLDPDNPLDQALSFREFWDGMDTCQARRQVYFIDACRTASPTLITRYNGFTGHAVIPGSNNSPGGRIAPIYYSTNVGASAYGRENKSSVFTEALLKCFNGAGSSDLEEPDVYRVQAEDLPKSLRFVQERILGSASGLSQVPSTGGELGEIVLHVLKSNPIVPVAVILKPENALPFARLGYNRLGDNQEVIRGEEEDVEWDLDLVMGDYRFFAQVNGGGFHNVDHQTPVKPPYRKIPLEVGE